MTWDPGPPSRAHAAGAAAFLLAAAGWTIAPWLAAVPLAAFVVLCVTATQFPAWSFFLPIALHGPRTRPEVALTFDDGPDPRTLPALLELLSAAGAPATFFLVGRRAEAHPGAVRALLEAGHTLGNHSQTHDVLLSLRSSARIRGEIEACQAALRPFGVRPRFFRPPVGITSPPMARELRRLGLRCVCFSCRPLDFGNRRLDDLAGRVLSRVRPGDVILLHDLLPAATPVEGWRAEIARILAGLAARGLAVVPLERLLGEPAMDAAPGAEAPPPASHAAAGPGAWARLTGALQAALLVGYPLIVLGAVSWLGARGAALLLLALLAVSRARTLRDDLRRARGVAWLGASVVLLLALAAVLDDPRFLLVHPALVNAVLLAQFAWSLRGGGSMAERFARLQVDDLTPAELRYCRRVTLVWCGFFVLNGAACALLAALAPRTWWAAYAGGISYVLVGVLFAVEYVVRKARYGRFGPGLPDRVLARVLSRAEGSR